MTDPRSSDVPAEPLFPPPGPRRRRRPLLLDLALVAAFVAWFHWPYLGRGLPPGDFASDVVGREIGRKLVPTPLNFPTWSPWTMCGRPVIDYWSPFRPLDLPFAHLDPIARTKAQVVLFQVLAGLLMYALLAGVGGGEDAALFAGLVYPLGPATIARAAVHGHIHVVMYLALAPLVLLALFRLRRLDPRSTAVLALVLALGLLRDTQRTLLLVVLLSLVLVLGLALAWRGPGPERRRRLAGRAALAAGFAVAVAVAVAVNAYELVNGFLGQPDEGPAFQAAEQRAFARQYALDGVGGFLDRGGALASWLGRFGPGFERSTSGYLGLTLLALVAVGLLRPDVLGRHRRHFRLAVALLLLSAWLGFGDTAPWRQLAERWAGLVGSPAVPPAVRLLPLAALAAAAVFGTLAVARNLGPFRRRLAPLAAFLALAALLLLVAPYPLVRQVFFFLRDHRNPGWFPVAAAPLVTTFAAALVAGALCGRLGRPALRTLAVAALAVVVAADLWPYRRLLTSEQYPAEAVLAWRRAAETIARDPADVRVAGQGASSGELTLSHIWHGKRTAWEFRSYAAPRRTREYFRLFHHLAETGRAPDLLARLGGLANVKYLLANPSLPAPAGSRWRPLVRERWIGVLENLDQRPFLQPYPQAQLLLGPGGTDAILLAARLAGEGQALAHLDRRDEADPDPGFAAVWTDAAAAARALAPAGAAGPPPGAGGWTGPSPPPALSWQRPRPELIVVRSRAERPYFLLVSESYHRWWSARVGGREARLYPAGYAFLGTFVPAGEQSVELRFRVPPSFRAWGWLSLVSVAVTTVLALRRRLLPGRQSR